MESLPRSALVVHIYRGTGQSVTGLAQQTRQPIVRPDRPSKEGGTRVTGDGRDRAGLDRGDKKIGRCPIRGSELEGQHNDDGAVKLGIVHC